MTVISDYLASTAKVTVNAQRFDLFVNGGPDDVVTIDGGATVRSLRGVQKYGGMPIATQAEAEAGTANDRNMTPLRVAQEVAKLIPFASKAEAEAGADNTKVLTALRVAQAIAAQATGAITIASQAEAEAGTINNKFMTPLRTAQAIAKQAASGGGGSGPSYSPGTFMSFSNTTPAPTTNTLRATGYSAPGLGSFEMAYDPTVDGNFVAAFPRSAVILAGGKGFRNVEQVLMPEMFGAIGDGLTDDTAALIAMSKEVQRRGGGTISLRAGATYICGTSTANAGIGPSPITLTGLAGAIKILGNGGVIKTASGQKYGSYNPSTGAKQNSLNDGTYATSPYAGAINIQNCSGSIWIENLELDGNLVNLKVGGTYGDTGYQVPHCGLLLLGNTGQINWANINTHDHGQDGIETSSPVPSNSSLRVPIFGVNVRSEYNGRQGWSMIGGRGSVIVNGKFNFTGRRVNAGTNQPLYSAPGAGIDIEAEGNNINRDLTLINCEAVCNMGVGFVSDTGDSADINLIDCTVIGGPASYALWPAKPGWTVTRGRVIGPSVQFFADPSGVQSIKFKDTRFFDDPNLSPMGALMSGPIVDLGSANANPLFEGVVMTLTNNSTLPYHPNGARYKDCPKLSQTNTNSTVMSGTFMGVNVISSTGGTPNLINSSYPYGVTTLNGTVVSGASGGGGSASGPWTAYAPTFSAGNGTLGSGCSASGRYRVDGKTVFFNVQLSIPSGQNGSASSFLKLSLPVNVYEEISVNGRENSITGKLLSGVVVAGTKDIIFQNYDASYPGGDGYRLRFVGAYEAA